MTRQCPHGFHHPGNAGSVPHSCDGCWCDDERDIQRGWPIIKAEPIPVRKVVKESGIS